MTEYVAEVIGRYSFAQSAHCDDCKWVKGPDATTPEAAQAHAVRTGHLVVTQELHRTLYRRRKGSPDDQLPAHPQPDPRAEPERGPVGV